MGAIVIIVPNISDYWIEVFNPAAELLSVVEQYESEILQEIKLKEKQKWQYFKISSFLLSFLTEKNETVNKLLSQHKQQIKGQWLFVNNLTKQETLTPSLYQLLSSKCEIRQPNSTSQAIRQCFDQNLLFRYLKGGDILNLHNSFSDFQIETCKQLPTDYLLLQFQSTFNISIVSPKQYQLVAQNPINEKKILALIRKVISRKETDQLNYTVDDILKEILEEGNFQKADLLVEDIFGPGNCQIIGLPPKLIASSLAKFAKESSTPSNIWDQLQSLLVAFAINIGILAKEQVLLTKMSKVIFKTNEIAHNRFFKIVNTILAPYAEVWFIKGGNTPLLHSSTLFKAQEAKQ